MKKFILISFLFLLSTFVFAKGGKGEYFISGKAYLNNELIANEMMTVSFNDKIWKVETNFAGKFEMEIPWMSACPSGISNNQKDSLNNVLNPKWITISYKGKILKIENLWKKYRQLGYENKSDVTRKLDLKFE